jgi:hypothetical protein
MAVSSQLYQWQTKILDKLKLNYSDLSICELGDQMYQSESHIHTDYLMRHYYSGKVKKYLSIDIHGLNGAIAFDLSEDLLDSELYRHYHTSYELVTCYSMLQHIPNQIRAINNAIRLATCDGLILFSLPITRAGWMPTGRYTYEPGFIEKLAKLTQSEFIYEDKLLSYLNRYNQNGWTVLVGAIKKTSNTSLLPIYPNIQNTLASLGIRDSRDTTHTDNYTKPGRWAVPTDQQQIELDWLLDFMVNHNVRSVLTLGPEFGGVEYEMAKRYSDLNLPLSILALDHRAQLLDQAAYYIHHYCPTVSFTGLKYDLNSTDMKDLLLGRYDLVFIDADHAYKAVSSDFERALRHTDKYIALHDIIDASHFGPGDFVAKLWADLKSRFSTQEMCVNSTSYGIGIVDLTQERKLGSV